MVLIPLGRLPETSPDTPLGSRRLLFLVRPHPPAGGIHGSPQTKSRKSQESPRSQPRPRSHAERSLPVPVPASSPGLSVVNPDAAGIDVHSNMHMVCVPADRDANPGPAVRRQHRRSSGDRRVVEEVPRENDRIGNPPAFTGFLLFELLESEGFEVYLVEPGQLSALRTHTPKTDVLDAPMDPSGCIPTVSCVPRFGLRISCWCCVPTGGSGRCRCATPPVMSSTCRRPWSK